MKSSVILAATGCVVVLFAATPVAFAQRSGGGHAGGKGGGRVSGGGMSIGRGVTKTSPGPVLGPRGIVGVPGKPFVPRGPVVGPRGFVGGRPFVTGGGFVREGPFVKGGALMPGRSFAPLHFFHPYYAFRPHLQVGFGIWAGHPFGYPYPYYYPFYSYSSVYPPLVDAPYDYARDATATSAPSPSGSIEAQPAPTNLGGLSFEVKPGTAELFVDDNLVGTVGEFTPTTQPLGLEAGRHHVELRAPGYQTSSFDVDIVAGQVIPYRGSLER